MNQDLFIDFFIALFALLNPLLAIPVFLGLTADYSNQQRQRTAAVAAVATLIALIVAAFIGDQIMNLFGIHVPSFQIAGGLIVLTIALAMLKDDPGKDGGPTEAAKQAASEPHRNIAVYPLAIPLLAGPGAFVTTIIFSSRVDSVWDMVSVIVALAVIILILWLAMAFASTVARFLNEAAINICTKVLGILLAAVSVEMVLAGVDAHFIPLISGIGGAN